MPNTIPRIRVSYIMVRLELPPTVTFSLLTPMISPIRRRASRVPNSRP